MPCGSRRAPVIQWPAESRLRTNGGTICCRNAMIKVKGSVACLPWLYVSYEPLHPSDRQYPDDDLDAYLGLAAREAERRAGERGWQKVRSLLPGAIVTLEYVAGRLNFTVDEGGSSAAGRADQNRWPGRPPARDCPGRVPAGARAGVRAGRDARGRAAAADRSERGALIAAGRRLPRAAGWWPRGPGRGRAGDSGRRGAVAVVEAVAVAGGALRPRAPASPDTARRQTSTGPDVGPARAPEREPSAPHAATRNASARAMAGSNHGSASRISRPAAQPSSTSLTQCVPR